MTLPEGALEVVDVLRTPVSVVNMSTAVSTILGWLAKGEAQFVCVRDVHGVMCSFQDKKLANVERRAGMIVPDGMPLSWIGRLRGHREMRRVAGPDLVYELCEATSDGQIGHYFYGGTEGVASAMIANLKREYPHLKVCGYHMPPFRPLTEEEDRQIVDEIVNSGAKIVWVGISTPKQDYWMRDHVQRIPGATLIGVGAAFDFSSGFVSRAPLWMQHAGLEWLFRLISEPSRLWRRYLILAPKFVWYMFVELIGGTRRSRPE